MRKYSVDWYNGLVSTPDGRAKYNRQAIMYRRLELAKDPTRARCRKMLDHAKERASRRGLLITIKLDDILALALDVCPILGIRLEWDVRLRSDASPTLDRLDNRLGYVAENILVMSWRANRLKSDGTSKELRQIADYIDARNLA